MAHSHHPFHPIIYVRGFAATSSEIEEAVADPYMGFNLGSTKARAIWTGETRKFYFESPLVRLMGEHQYDDVFVEGSDLLTLERSPEPVGYRSVIIYRYYDSASEAFGDGEGRPIEYFAKGLSELILKLRAKVCDNPANQVSPQDFRVYLVAHSMGGLICRAFLQNPALGSSEARSCVDKLFTYATPHNGIDLRLIGNVPGWATFGDADNFNRKRMSQYLGLQGSASMAQITQFPAERVFNLVGTNPADYAVMRGLSSWAAGDASDGLVRIENATTASPDGVQSPNAFVNRSHSGHFGIVNSEEGYQNLVRFLFGKVRFDGYLRISDIPLPIEVEKAREKDKDIKASYQIEVVVSVRGTQWQMHRRTVREHSAIFRRFDEMFEKVDGKWQPRPSLGPRLFSVFLDPSKSVKSTGSVSFGFDINILVPDYEVDGTLFLKKHYEGGFIFRDLIIVEATPDEDAPGGWRISYGFQSSTPGNARTRAPAELKEGELVFFIPIEKKGRPGVTARLEVRVQDWN